MGGTIAVRPALAFAFALAATRSFSFPPFLAIVTLATTATAAATFGPRQRVLLLMALG